MYINVEIQRGGYAFGGAMPGLVSESRENLFAASLDRAGVVRPYYLENEVLDSRLDELLYLVDALLGGAA